MKLGLYPKIAADGIRKNGRLYVPYPVPANPVITHDPASLHPLADAVFASYDIAEDDAALRAAPEQFEDLRGSYRVRREFPAYTVRSDKPLPSALRDTLLKLGFHVE